MMRERIMATSPKEEIPTSELVSFSRQRKQEMMVRMIQETMRIVVLDAVMPIIEKGRRDEKSVNTIIAPMEHPQREIRMSHLMISYPFFPRTYRWSIKQCHTA